MNPSNLFAGVSVRVHILPADWNDGSQTTYHHLPCVYSAAIEHDIQGAHTAVCDAGQTRHPARSRSSGGRCPYSSPRGLW